MRASVMSVRSDMVHGMQNLEKRCHQSDSKVFLTLRTKVVCYMAAARSSDGVASRLGTYAKAGVWCRTPTLPRLMNNLPQEVKRCYSIHIALTHAAPLLTCTDRGSFPLNTWCPNIPGFTKSKLASVLQKPSVKLERDMGPAFRNILVGRSPLIKQELNLR